MDYFLINTMPSENPEYCFLDNVPKGTEDFTYRMSKGKMMGDDYPKNAKIYMDDDNSGIKLPSLIGNTNSFLIASKEVKEVIESLNSDPTEYLSFDLYNHKKRIASKNYFIINPLIILDCLNIEKSEIEWEEDEVVGIDKFILDPDKLKSAPDIFRIKEEPFRYVISHKLALELQKINATNIYLILLEQAE